jgi:hypothetical protein
VRRDLTKTTGAAPGKRRAYGAVTDGVVRTPAPHSRLRRQAASTRRACGAPPPPVARRPADPPHRRGQLSARHPYAAGRASRPRASPASARASPPASPTRPARRAKTCGLRREATSVRRTERAAFHAAVPNQPGPHSTADLQAVEGREAAEAGARPLPLPGRAQCLTNWTSRSGAPPRAGLRPQIPRHRRGQFSAPHSYLPRAHPARPQARRRAQAWPSGIANGARPQGSRSGEAQRRPAAPAQQRQLTAPRPYVPGVHPARTRARRRAQAWPSASPTRPRPQGSRGQAAPRRSPARGGAGQYARALAPTARRPRVSSRR